MQPHSSFKAVPGVTLGMVVDVNDPQQQGRLRVACPALNDPNPSSESFNKETVPWALFAPGFAGVSLLEGRGPDEIQSEGPVAYGEWNRPSKGATALDRDWETMPTALSLC